MISMITESKFNFVGNQDATTSMQKQDLEILHDRGHWAKWNNSDWAS